MFWLWSRQERTSQKNGRIVIRRRFGRYTITVDGYTQTGSYTRRMWQGAFRRVQKYAGLEQINRILILGMGAGSEIKALKQRFPDAQMTVIEHDSEMIALARELKLYRGALFPYVLCGDAREVIHTLTEKFGLIVIHMSTGRQTSQLLKEETFIKELDRVLAPNGFLLMNACRTPELFELVSQSFTELRQWRYRWSRLGLFHKRTLLCPPYESFAPLFAWPDVDPVNLIEAAFAPAKLENGGWYWRLWPFSLERYGGDTEPLITPLPKDKRMPIRIITWQRMTPIRPHVRWWKPGGKVPNKTGIVPIDGVYDMPAHWSKSARYSLRQWRELTDAGVYVVEPISFEDFEEGYRVSNIPRSMKSILLGDARKKMRAPTPVVTFWGVRRAATGELVAGLCSYVSTAVPCGYYLAGFYTPAAQHDPVMLGLLDAWFKVLRDQGIKYGDLGMFWTGSDMRSWRGFSLFKMKFNPLYFFYPPLLYRLEFPFGRYPF